MRFSNRGVCGSYFIGEFSGEFFGEELGGVSHAVLAAAKHLAGADPFKGLADSGPVALLEFRHDALHGFHGFRAVAAMMQADYHACTSQCSAGSLHAAHAGSETGAYLSHCRLIGANLRSERAAHSLSTIPSARQLPLTGLLYFLFHLSKFYHKDSNSLQTSKYRMARHVKFSTIHGIQTMKPKNFTNMVFNFYSLQFL